MKPDPYVVEANYLTILWQAKDGPEARRMALLKRLSSVVIERGPGWDYPTLRREPAPIALEDWCFGCGATNRGMHRHHIIQLQHGGSNSPRNVVSLCPGCHAVIHPWMDAPTTHQNRRGWTKVGDMIPWFFRQLERFLRR